MQFTAEQLAAISRRSAPQLLLDAGAGSGKTAVLVECIVRAVVEDHVGVGQILAITFTDKAAAELRERVRAELRKAGGREAASALDSAWVSTIDAFCARVLRLHPLEAGLDPEFAVLDERAAAPLRQAAFRRALALSASSETVGQLISAYGVAALRSAVLSTYAELRTRGAGGPREPPGAAPPPPPPPEQLEIRGSILRVQACAAAALRELGAVRSPGRRVLDALALLEGVSAGIPAAVLWPGGLERLRLGTGAAALRGEACERYSLALAELQTLARAEASAVVHAGLNALLAAYGEQYAQLKRERGALDFSDLELRARDLLASGELGSRYRERFVRVMVDELQDTNQLQLELVELVSGSSLVTVGDAQQAIYGFRHAQVELFEQRGRRLEDADARLSLQTNFRSRPELLTVLNAAFANALGDSFRPLRAGRELPSAPAPAPGPLVELILADRDGAAAAPEAGVDQLAAPWRVAEARALAARIAQLIADGEARAGEIVVLLRASTGMGIYERALDACGVPSYVVGGRGFWAQPQLVELVSYLRALANPRDGEALATVLCSPLCGLSVDGLVLVCAGAEDQLEADDTARLADFRSWFDAERRVASWLGAEELIDRALLRNGYELTLARCFDARRRLANVRKLMALAREFEQAHGSDLRGFVEQVRTQAQTVEGAEESEAPVESESMDAVRMMTIHRSKGLEFPVVCVADLGRQAQTRSAPIVIVGRDGVSLGLRLRHPGQGGAVSALDYEELSAQAQARELEEERRLFYVAMTRARERLIISGAARFDGWEQANRHAPIGWVAPALVPDIAARVAAASAASPAGAPLELPTEHGVLVRLAGSFAPAGTNGALGAEAGAQGEPSPVPAPYAPACREPGAQPAPLTLSYSALALHERCGYRFYLQRVLGLSDQPDSVLAAGPEALERDRTSSRQRPLEAGAERGVLIHRLLSELDFRSPSLSAAMPSDVRELLAALTSSETFARLAGLRDRRREQRFAFAVGETLITGIFDLLARERDGSMVVIDYKSDRLGAVRPHELVASRYELQRSLYALAALELGAERVEVMHLFLEAPDEPAAHRYSAAQTATLRAQLARRVAAVHGPGADYAVTGSPGREVCDGCPARGGLCSHAVALTFA
jgi:ATP-dependent exoDNAse (exonuclease V) beta subunit